MAALARDAGGTDTVTGIRGERTTMPVLRQYGQG